MGKNYIRTVEQLAQYISLTANEKLEIQEIIENYPMSVNQYYLNLINWHDPYDPIRRMAIPSIQESCLEGHFDTSGEHEDTKFCGLQHKYPETALILCSNNCATYCRYCFRKRFVGASSNEIVKDWNKVVKYICEHREITNVLLSGGDPLMLPTDRIADILQRLSGIAQLKFIRIGTRVPVTYPDKIVSDNELLKVLKECASNRKRLYITTQFNHPKEITAASIAAINKLIDSHLIINNQTVLLKGVNDNPAVMAELQSLLTKIGVVPYYIFQCRPVKNIANNFQVPLYKAGEIIEETRSMLDGLSKRFRFVMSHEAGKIEILGCIGESLYFKYHQSKDKFLRGKIFYRKLHENDCWLDWQMLRSSCLQPTEAHNRNQAK